MCNRVTYISQTFSKEEEGERGGEGGRGQNGVGVGKLDMGLWGLLLWDSVLQEGLILLTWDLAQPFHVSIV